MGPTFSDGVYKAGFAGTQEAYEKAVYPLFDSLDRLEKMLTGKDYLVGDRLTEADIRLFVTIVSVFLSISSSWRTISFAYIAALEQIRFDPVYVGHFKCNLRTIRNGYPVIHT